MIAALSNQECNYFPPVESFFFFFDNDNVTKKINNIFTLCTDNYI